MGQRIDGNIEREFASLFRIDAVALIAFVAHGKGADQAILAHNSDELAIMVEAIEQDILMILEIFDVINVVERMVN